MRAVNTDATSYQSKNPKKCLETAEKEKEKKKNYLDACLKQRCCFNPFVASVDGFLGVDVEATRKPTSSRLPTKWKEPYSFNCGYMNIRVAITLSQAAHRCIRGPGFRPLKLA